VKQGVPILALLRNKVVDDTNTSTGRGVFAAMLQRGQTGWLSQKVNAVHEIVEKAIIFRTSVRCYRFAMQSSQYSSLIVVRIR
jgi:hypothetical protein